MNRIIVIFKTHLDLGFTGYASDVTEQYMKSYIPNALKLAKEMRGEKERFIWTTGSWLIEKYMEEGDRELLEDAVRHGEIRWHGLPFTTHTELMDRELFRYGLGISRKLDRTFGVRTTAAKLTDVPGHTKAMIPLLAEMGVRFLHIGVNPASAVPEVPGLFRWKADTGESVTVMYNADYGQMTEIGNSGEAVYFAHTSDNKGPQSAEQVREIYRRLHEQYPEAEIVPGTLEDVAEIAEGEALETVTEEIGDTWIHGAGSDPRKMNGYRGLLRLKDSLPQQDMEEMYRSLILIPEHTWGYDEKTCLGTVQADGEVIGEHRYFRKEEFHKALHEERFLRIERSWQEQREYLLQAAAYLPKSVRVSADRVMREYKRAEQDVTGWQSISPEEELEMNGWTVRVADSGEIEVLSCGEEIYHPGEFCAGKFMYEVFSEKEYDRFHQEYLTSRDIWAQEDFGKTGMREAVTEYQKYEPRVTEIRRRADRLVIRMKLPEEAVRLYGGMRRIEMAVDFTKDRIRMDLAWFEKEKSRVAEAAWLNVKLPEGIRSIRKMGTDLNPYQVVSKGNRRMHAVDDSVRTEEFIFHTLDAPLVSLGGPTLLTFPDTVPKADGTFSVNLINNVWGTNFMMWYGEDARFRFELKREESFCIKKGTCSLKI